MNHVGLLFKFKCFESNTVKHLKSTLILVVEVDSGLIINKTFSAIVVLMH